MEVLRWRPVLLAVLASCGGTEDNFDEGGTVFAEEQPSAKATGPDPSQGTPIEVPPESASTGELLEFLRGPEGWAVLTSNESSFESGKWGLVEELSQRESDLEVLVKFYQGCEYSAGKDALLMALSGMGDIARQHPMLVNHVPEGLYQGSFSWVVEQAREGNPEALNRLVENFWEYAVPSRDLAALPVFLAEQGRRELIPEFVHWINAADMSLGGACFSAMQIFYPESDPPTEGPGVASRYYVDYASAEFPELAED